MSEPFIFRLPAKIANDPELAPYFNALTKAMHDLTAIRGPAIDSPTADVASLKVAVDKIIDQLETDGTITS